VIIDNTWNEFIEIGMLLTSQKEAGGVLYSPAFIFNQLIVDDCQGIRSSMIEK
jgi:hypothetical protein